MTDKELKCPICGEPTYKLYGNYRKDGLCAKHGKMAKNGEIVQCADCGKWHKADEPCNCQYVDFPQPTDSLTCIVCGADSNGKHFCHQCWNAYKNKILYLKIRNCKEFEKLDAEYASDLVCDDGHLVKSSYEKIIDNWLYKENIQHAYEIKIDVDKDRDLTPDFYLPEYNGKKNIYIEFWGIDTTIVKDKKTKEYKNTKEYKMKIYPELCKRENITVIYLTKKEVEDDSYKKKIKYAEAGKVNK